MLLLKKYKFNKLITKTVKNIILSKLSNKIGKYGYYRMK